MKQSRLIPTEEEYDIEKLMLRENCSREEARRRLAAKGKKAVPAAEPGAHWADEE